MFIHYTYFAYLYLVFPCKNTRFFLFPFDQEAHFCKMEKGEFIHFVLSFFLYFLFLVCLLV